MPFIDLMYAGHKWDVIILGSLMISQFALHFHTRKFAWVKPAIMGFLILTFLYFSGTTFESYWCLLQENTPYAISLASFAASVCLFACAMTQSSRSLD